MLELRGELFAHKYLTDDLLTDSLIELKLRLVTRVASGRIAPDGSKSRVQATGRVRVGPTLVQGCTTP